MRLGEISATAECLSTRQPVQVEKCVPELGRWLEVRAYPVFDPGGSLTNVIEHLRDITERKHAELALLESERKYRELVEVFSVGSDITERKRAEEERDKLQSQLLQAQKIESVGRLAGMLKMLRRLIGENIHLLWSPGASLWPVRMDPTQVDHILANLCVNARDAIQGVGTVSIETSNVTLGPADAQSHPECVAGPYVLLTVSDTGKGMDSETRSHLFEPFFTTKPQGQGTGLGLATIFGIVKQNQGLISVCSEPGQGSTFKIYLPGAEAQAPAVTPDDRQCALRGAETILLVEDEEQILTLARRILEQHGHTVLTSSCPSAAIALADEHQGLIRLLITDVVMPEMNGRELRGRLEGLKPGVQCLYKSGYTANVIAHHGVLDEGLLFLQKPFTIESLLARVREALRHRPGF